MFFTTEARITILTVIAVPFVVLAFRNMAAARSASIMMNAAEFILKESRLRRLDDSSFVTTIVANLITTANFAPFIVCKAVEQAKDTRTLQQIANDAIQWDEFFCQQEWLLQPLAEASLALDALAWFARPLDPRSFVKTSLSNLILWAMPHLGYRTIVDQRKMAAEVERLEKVATVVRAKYGDHQNLATELGGANAISS